MDAAPGTRAKSGIEKAASELEDAIKPIAAWRMYFLAGSDESAGIGLLLHLAHSLVDFRRLRCLFQYLRSEILERDRQAPRKQRHTAPCIYTRLAEEHPEHPISEPTVRRYVAVRKREYGLNGREVFIPQSYQLGQEA